MFPIDGSLFYDGGVNRLDFQIVPAPEGDYRARFWRNGQPMRAVEFGCADPAPSPETLAYLALLERSMSSKEPQSVEMACCENSSVLGIGLGICISTIFWGIVFCIAYAFH